MDFAGLFHRHYSKSSPKENILQNSTRATMDFLLDNDIGDIEIMRILEESAGKECIRKEDLPDRLWDGSLIERGAYYFNRELQIIPDGESLPYLEIRIRFTMDDLISMFLGFFKVDPALNNRRYFAGQFSTMLKKYSQVECVKPLDFVITMMKVAKLLDVKVFEPFDIERNSIPGKTLDKLKRHVAEARAENADGEIERCYQMAS